MILGLGSHSPSNTISLLSTDHKMEDSSALTKKSKECKFSMDKTSKKSVSQDFDKVMKSKLKQNKNFSTSKAQNSVKSKYKSLDSLLDKEKALENLENENDFSDSNKEDSDLYVDMSRSTQKDQDSDSMVYQVFISNPVYISSTYSSFNRS